MFVVLCLWLQRIRAKHFFLEQIYSKSIAMEIWLLGYEITDTVVVISRNKSVQFLTSAKKINFLAPLKNVWMDIFD